MNMSVRWHARILTIAVGVFVLAVGDRPGAVFAQQLTLLSVGDIEWSRAVKPPVGWQSERGEWISIPYLNLEHNRDSISARLGRPLEGERAHHLTAIRYDLAFASTEEDVRHPFQRTFELLRSADVAFANLEMPLSARARHTGAFRGNTSFADALRWAGIDIVSIANNHAFDAEAEGLRDTMETLWRAGVGFAGGGHDLESARKPFIIERNGLKLAFLAYTWSVNLFGLNAYAQPALAGVMPLDPFIIKEDIRRVRGDVDYVILSFHWSVENSQDTRPEDRAFARQMIDAGADIILGHHPHVPRGFEIYNGKPIFYSLGNFIFGHSHDYWVDNYAARLTLTRGGVTQVEIIPLAGTGTDLSQPFVLEGERAQGVLRDVQERSALLDTRLEIVGDRGVVRVRRATNGTIDR
jgi:poly-gamma-glutamate capsule biosynthesis protein CapA/YwtB (metallophosphatase superfamily)